MIEKEVDAGFAVYLSAGNGLAPGIALAQRRPGCLISALIASGRNRLGDFIFIQDNRTVAGSGFFNF